MVRKLLLVGAWFPLTFLLVFLNLNLLLTYGRTDRVDTRLSASLPQDGTFQLAAPGTAQVLSANVVSADARVYLIEQFLKTNSSPMTPYAGVIVSESDRFGIDFRLIPAIAMCESGAGKHMPKKKEYNFAGIAVYTGQNIGKAFDSWEHAIAWVAEYVKTKYYDRGITNLKDIGAIWAPPSVESGYSWTNCVESFQQDII